MKLRISTALFATLFAFAVSAHDTIPATVIPAPASVETHDGCFTFTPQTVITVENGEQKALAEEFASLFTVAADFTPRIKSRGNGAMRFVTDRSLAHEAYTLDITPTTITVRAADRSGFFYALQTLRQLLPAGIESHTVTNDRWSVPALHIEDAPRFGYRCLLLDPSRYFIPKEEVLKIIDVMSMLKLNKLHLHLTDDNGWRIEIKRYPLLTEVGAWRVDRPDATFPARRNPLPGEPTPVGGFYTQDDIREIVAFAADRCIEVVPEIDMPAHANAALAAYPEYACPVVDKFIGVLPGIGGDNADIIYCAGNDKTFEFLRNILDEVLELFPSRYIHLGGDEAWKTHWKTCPLCQARIKAEGLRDEEELQGWFMAQMCGYVRGKGREVMGWDELTNSTLPEGVIIAGWQGMGNAALKAAAQGHRFVMTPARLMYFIRYQGPQWFEPDTYFAGGTLKDVYMYEPVQKNWAAGYEDLLMGVQACMWTEFCDSPRDVEHQLFPRTAALAEVAWAARNTKDWEGFLPRLDNFLPRLEAHGAIYAHSMYNLEHKVVPADGKLRVTLECIRPDVEIRYTTDGSEPSAQSPLYESALLFDKPATLKAATFAGGEMRGSLLELPMEWNKATAKPVVNARGDELLLTNGVRGSLKQTDGEWCSWTADDASFTLDLGASEEISKISLGFVTNFGMAVNKPAAIKIETSDDNETFTLLAERTYDEEDIFREGRFTEEALFETDARARYVRITVTGAGKCPASHTRPGKDSKFYIDEVIIN